MCNIMYVCMCKVTHTQTHTHIYIHIHGGHKDLNTTEPLSLFSYIYIHRTKTNDSNICMNL